METREQVDLLKSTNDEVEGSKKILQTLSNEIGALSDFIQPQLMKHVSDLRSARMSVTTEINESLKALREIRKFFIEDDYKVEMERLQRFVDVCKELKALKESGVLDAVCDSAIRLAVKEVNQ